MSLFVFHRRNNSIRFGTTSGSSLMWELVLLALHSAWWDWRAQTARSDSSRVWTDSRRPGTSPSPVTHEHIQLPATESGAGQTCSYLFVRGASSRHQHQMKTRQTQDGDEEESRNAHDRQPLKHTVKVLTTSKKLIWEKNDPNNNIYLKNQQKLKTNTKTEIKKLILSCIHKNFFFLQKLKTNTKAKKKNNES